MEKGISGASESASKFIEIDGAKIHYLEAGAGDDILFLHGIPTSSYLWRNIVPMLAPLGRCIAPDLIGFGKSDKPNIEYTIFDHIRYIEKFIELLNLKNIIIVMHGWGSIIGFQYAMYHEKNCKGLAFYEAFLHSLSGDSLSLPFEEQLKSWQNMRDTQDTLLSGSDFIDKTLPQQTVQQLTDEILAQYREPFLQDNSSKPVLQYLKELSDKNSKSKLTQLIEDYSTKLTQSTLPKLMLYSVPGFITTIATVIWAKENLPSIEITDIGEELHLAQESNPRFMGGAISAWLQAIETI